MKVRVLRAMNMGEDNALHEAAKYNHESVANVLLEEDVELAFILNNAGMSPLYLAIMMRCLKVAKALLQSFSWEKPFLAFVAGLNKKIMLHAVVLLNLDNYQGLKLIYRS